VTIEFNVPAIDLGLLGSFQDCLNDAPLWGLPPRCIKCSKIDWERKFIGICTSYYMLKMEFDINVKVDQQTGNITSGFDRDIRDEGTKALHGHWGQTTPPFAIQSASNSAPITLTLSTVGNPTPTASFSQGQTVLVQGVSGNTNANGSWNINITGPKTMQLLSSNGNAAGSGGTVQVSAAMTWVLDTIGGALPDPANPQHFDRYKDRNGENTKVILNGAGIPADSVRPIGNVEVSQYQPVMAGDDIDILVEFVGKLGGGPQPLMDIYDLFLLPNTSSASVDDITETDDNNDYQLLRFAGATGGQFTLVFAGDETDLINYSTNPSTLTSNVRNALLLLSSIGYQDPTNVTIAGTIHVEKYNEANLLLLGIPTALTAP
jgi:hypothetical protein